MTCIVCHGEDVRMADSREELQIGMDIVYVPIRVPVCQTCGEKYYDRRTVRYLEEVEGKLKDGKATLHEVGKVLMYQ